MREVWNRAQGALTQEPEVGAGAMHFVYGTAFGRLARPRHSLPPLCLAALCRMAEKPAFPREGAPVSGAV